MSGFPRLPPSAGIDAIAQPAPPPPKPILTPPRPAVPGYVLAGPAVLALAIFAPGWIADAVAKGQPGLSIGIGVGVAALAGIPFAWIAYSAWGRSRAVAIGAFGLVLAVHGFQRVLPTQKPAVPQSSLVVTRDGPPLGAAGQEPVHVTIASEDRPEKQTGRTPPVIRVYRRSQADATPAKDR